jgi:hypothetical protein
MPVKKQHCPFWIEKENPAMLESPLVGSQAGPSAMILPSR